MLKRLGALFAVLALIGCCAVPAASAHTTAVPATGRGHWLRFTTAGIPLGDVGAAQVRIGNRRFGLSVRRLRAAGRARAVVVIGVVAAAATGAVLDLTLDGGHHAATAPAAATSPAPLARSAGSGSGGVVSLNPLLAGMPSSVSSDPRLVIGLNVGSAIVWELQFARSLGAHNVRMDIPITTPISQIDPIIAAYAAAGVRPELLATFDGTIPTAAQDAVLATWATRYGPGGTFWSTGLYDPSLAVTRIEFGNETSFNYQYPQLANDPTWYSSPLYTRIAGQYARSYVQAVQDVSAVNPGVKVLAVADSPGQVPQWLQGMFRGAPDLARVVQGWILHPYGNDWRRDIDATLSEAQQLGASASVPVYVTEVGIASSGGNCLAGDYGWNPCETFSQAADTLTDQVDGIEADLGPRLAELDLYSARDLAADGSSNNPEDFFGALQSNGSPKGAFTGAVETILAGSAG